MTDKFGIGTLDLPVGQFSVFATWIVRPDKVAEVIPLIQENKRLCQDEPGTIEFHIARKGNKFYAWEKYADAEALKHHAEVNIAMHQLLARVDELFETMPEIHVLQVIC